MVRLSNNIVGILNVLTFVLSILILWTGLWLRHQASSECERFLEKPMIALGVFLMLVSIAGIVGACCRVTWLLWVYLLVMFVLIVLLFCFTIFAFVLTNKGAGEALSGKGYKEYHLGDYSNWLQKRVSANKNWSKIRSCLVDSKVCEDQHFNSLHLSPMKYGCCKPWSDCNFDCESCKAGVLDSMKSNWEWVAVVNLIFLVFLIIVYSIGCSAFRNNRRDNSWNHHRV